MLDEIGQVQAELEDLLATGRTPLPAEPDLDTVTVTDWSVHAHRRHWDWT